MTCKYLRTPGPTVDLQSWLPLSLDFRPANQFQLPMSRSRNEVLESTASDSLSLTSGSSDAFVAFYEERLWPQIDTISKSLVPLSEMVDAAEKIINEKFASDSRSRFRYMMGSETISVKLDRVLTAMLACADRCGGENGKRYVASSMLACSLEEDVTMALEALGTTWLTRFLFPCQCYCHS